MAFFFMYRVRRRVSTAYRLLLPFSLTRPLLHTQAYHDGAALIGLRHPWDGHGHDSHGEGH